jgi:hypothetical protein
MIDVNGLIMHVNLQLCFTILLLYHTVRYRCTRTSHSSKLKMTPTTTMTSQKYAKTSMTTLQNATDTFIPILPAHTNPINKPITRSPSVPSYPPSSLDPTTKKDTSTSIQMNTILIIGTMHTQQLRDGGMLLLFGKGLHWLSLLWYSVD